MSETLPDPTVNSEPGADSDPVIPPPLSDYDALLVRIQESPDDPESWKRLVDLAETSPKDKDYLPRIRQTYDAFLERYPNTAAVQVAYINHFLDAKEPHFFATAEQLFNKFLRTSRSVDLWKLYLKYVREVTLGPARSDIVHKAYEFALSHIGQDRDSESIRDEYVQFLAEEALTGREIQQKTGTGRETYTRAVHNIQEPRSGLNVSKISADNITAMETEFMQDLTPACIRARAMLDELSVDLQSTPTKMFVPTLPTLGCWTAYLMWEESNPEEKDREAVNSHIQTVYRKAVAYMRYSPDVWLMAFSWTGSIGKNDEALSILKEGLEANPDSFELTDAYAECLEKAELKKGQRNYSEVHTVYERFFGVLRIIMARLSAEAAAPALPTESAVEEPSLEVSGSSSETAEVSLLPVNQSQDELAERKKQHSNAWISYMSFAHRAQGQQAGRDAFGKARRDKYITWDVFEAAAMTEYRCNPDAGRHIASRIFETGMKRFENDVAYVLSYLGFLLTINDENNARVLLESAIGRFGPQEAKLLSERWSRSQYQQYQHDDLEAVLLRSDLRVSRQ